MPELPEVETVVQVLKTLVLNRTFEDVHIYWDNIIAHPDVDTFSKQIKGQTIKDINRHGKYIIFRLTDMVLVSHLRMEGKYYVYDDKHDKNKHVHVIFDFEDGGQFHYHDTRKFGKMYLYPFGEPIEALKNVGYEPWDENLNGKYLKSLARTRKIPIKSFLLDQSVVAGIGNIYVNEILFETKIHPSTPSYRITIKQFDEIILATQDILERAIKDGGTTIRSYTDSLGVTGLFQQSLLVHAKEHEACSVCGDTIIKIMVQQRGTYLCPTCQKRK